MHVTTTALTTAAATRFEIRLIDSTSPHFRLLECWGVWDLDLHDYVRVPGSSERIRRFYTLAVAEAFHRSLLVTPSTV